VRICSICLIALFGSVLAGIRVDAAEWYAQSSLNQQVSYDDNFDLATRSDEAESEWQSNSSAVLNVGASTASLEMQLNSVFDYAYFPETSSLNSADQAFNFNSTYQLERATVGLGADFIRDTTRTSDVNDTGLFIRANKRRQLYRVGPTWTYQVSQRDTLGAYGDYSSVSYQTKDLDSYWQTTGGFDWTHQLTARTQLQARLSGLHFHSGAGGDEETNSVSAEIGGTHDFSERWGASFFAGPRYVWIDNTARSHTEDMPERTSERDDSAGYVLNANVRYSAGEQTSVFATAARGVDPGTTTGIIEQTTAFGLSLNHQLLERVAINLSSSYSIQESIGDNSERRDYATVSPGVSWRLTKDLLLDCSYRFSWQRFDQTGEYANSNAVFATLTFQLPRLSASR
jgi:hypothetical protein